jgi:hypothetical protein
MVGSDAVRVLLVGEGAQEFFGCRQLFEWNHSQCHFAKSDREASEMLKASKFDIVLSTHKNASGSIQQLTALLSGSHASLFHSAPVKESYMWSPVLRFGKECSATPSLTAGELIYELDRMVKQIKAGFTARVS